MSGLAPSEPPVVVVAQQLSDLLLAFPSAAAGGVQWLVLVKKYEERFKERLDVQALGHSSALAAASTLLFDVLRIVDKDDTDNPVVGVDDAVALAPRPGLLGCWPSLYRALCTSVLENGVPEVQPSCGAVAGRSAGKSCSLLLSQIRPLLDRYWHANFDESGLGFLNEDGTFVRLKKLKHLLHAVLRWRDQRQAWRQSQQLKSSAVDDALAPCLVLAASDKHNDLLLTCVVEADLRAAPAKALGVARPVKPKSLEAFDVPEQPLEEPEEQEQVTKTPSTGSSSSVSEWATEDERLSEMQLQLERLRMENGSLWAENQVLRRPLPTLDASAGGLSVHCTPIKQQQSPLPEADIFDDPFEPTPEVFWSSRKHSTTDFGSNADTLSVCSVGSSSLPSGTPRWLDMHSSCGSEVASGAMTPVPSLQQLQQQQLQQQQQQQQQQQACTFMPMWFPLMNAFGGVEISVIPRGIVQTARAHFESLGGPK